MHPTVGNVFKWESQKTIVDIAAVNEFKSIRQCTAHAIYKTKRRLETLIYIFSTA